MQPLDASTFPAALRPIAEKVLAGERLDEAEALTCFTTADVLHLGRLAGSVRRRLHGDVAYFNVNRHINPTNICVYTYNCKFCGFAALPGEDHAWQMSHEEVWEHAAKQGGDKVTEFHIVGGLHPDLSLEWYLEMMRGLKERFPRVHLKAFTAIEIGWFAQREKISIEEVLVRLREAGLGSLPGGGAEIFHLRGAEIICDGKLDSDEDRGPSHGASARHPVQLHDALRARREAGAQGRPPAAPARPAGGDRRIQRLHPARLPPGEQLHGPALPRGRGSIWPRRAPILDNVPHLKAYWIMITPRLAQIALSFGADDVDGTVVEETIYHMAGADTQEHLEPFPGARAIVRESGYRAGRARRHALPAPRRGAAATA
ncbi:MAG: aminofutalosine synthase MqnE [Thermoanaerobaculia bacterium]